MNKRVARLAALLALTASYALAAQVIVINGDPPGVGFNDPTPATPIGGNPGVTVGQQALNVFQTAANKWGAKLQSPQPILVVAFFLPLPCTATSGVLGAAGANWYFANIEPAPSGKALRPDTFYPAALAEKITRQDIVVDPSDPFEIIAFFNSELGKPGCLTGGGWYYGLDNNEPPSQIDLLAVVLHEFGHGLGFSVGPTSSSTGARPLGFSSVWEPYMLDVTTSKRWIDMTNAERAASARSGGKLVWAGLHGSNVVPSVLDFRTEIGVLQPASIATVEEAQPAQFGPAIQRALRGSVVAPLDGGGASLLDGCEPFPPNPAIEGAIVLVDRGACAFTQKVKNAQDAGAAAAIVANNAASGLPPMGGFDPTITIPSIGITQALGATLRVQAATSPALVSIKTNPLIRAGTENNLPRLYTPTTFASGSSVSHWDTSATPNLLMEPFINTDLSSSVKNPTDLTLNLFYDIGW